MRRQLPLVITFIAGMIPAVSFFFRKDAMVHVSDTLEQWMIIVAGLALLLGVVNVTQSNLRKIERRAQGWQYSLLLLISLYTMGFFGVAGSFGMFGGVAARADGSLTPYGWMSEYMFIPLQGTMFALLAFYVASAAFRAFRMRNLEATLLLSAATIVMLGRIPFGSMLFAWVPQMGPIPPGSQWLPSLTEWIMSEPNAAAQRGIIIGAALGAASMSIRVIMGIERSYLGMKKGE